MTPAAKIATAFPSDDAATVLERMEEKDAEHVPVLYEGRWWGLSLGRNYGASPKSMPVISRVCLLKYKEAV
jgi:hypothetical protein